MLDFFKNLFDTEGWPRRWDCGTWSEGLGWLHILSDAAIFGAYTAIPCVLAFFVLRRRDIPFPRILWLFVAFIFACGFGHLVESGMFWNPVYRFSGLVKFITAIVSWGTVFALVQIVPQVLHFPGLARLNTQLRTEVDERKRIEDALRTSEEKLASLLQSERAARGEAERANRIKDEFLSTVSHELRTPLNSILGYAQLLQRESSQANCVEGLSIIERNAKIQAQIIEDLLDMSRIISGKVRLDAKSVDVGQVIEASIATVRHAAEAKAIRIQTVLDPNAGFVLGDSARLQQVVWNLLTNAVKFTPKGGRVQVALQRINSHLEIRVSDTGEGIKTDFLPFVFDRFRQADPGTTRKHGGLGLGLSIVRNLVELHGGTVEAKSPGEGQGSTFIVRLPIQIVHDEKIPPSTEDGGKPRMATSAAVSLRGIQILVVDDDADSRQLVKRVLSEYDATVRTAGSVDEALGLLRQSKPQAIISDIGMPEKDGYDLMRAVRSLPDSDGGKLPAIALTALARVEDRKRAMLAGYQAHVAKPVDPEELVAVVASLVGRTGK
jgi:signal transduction histidine kinase/CheY-like chemotaxis protein